MSSTYPPLQQKELPPAPRWYSSIGVGVVALGLAIGTGELILWPHLTTKFGLGILWGAVLGLTFQLFINKEVARHSLATGESFFLTSARIFKGLVWVWLLSAFALYIWPGWASALGTILVELIGFGDHRLWSWLMLVVLLGITFIGKSAYNTLERTLKIVVPIFFVMLVAVSFVNLEWHHIGEALRGMGNIGWIPPGIDKSVLFGAIVFAGTGGLLNLCVSLWYRDKLAGMGAYMGRLTNPVTGTEESASATGYSFEPDAQNLRRWKGWIRYITIDQVLIFWFLGVTSLVLLSLNAYAVLSPRGQVPEGLDIAVLQASIFGEQWGILGTKIFLVMAFLMLFSVMWAIISAFTRIITDILYVNAHTGPYQKYFSRFKAWSSSKIYYTLVVVLVIIQAVLIPLKAPLVYLTLTSVLGGFMMALYVPLLLYANNRRLPKPLRPGLFTNTVLAMASAFYLVLSFFVLIDSL